MSSSQSICFPCEQLPEDPGEARLLGIYPQRTEGLFMQRVKTPGGRITPTQLQGLARLGKRFTPDFPLHLTTRQAIEFHGLTADRIPELQLGIARLKLTPVGACGDTLRNITVSPNNGFQPGTWDVAGLASAITRYAESLPFIRALPRKFKIAISGGSSISCRPWINDLGLIANSNGSFQAIIAGSLGARPGTGMLLCEAVAAEDILPLVAGALQLFQDEGDREKRTRARLRHVRERLGDDEFRSRIDEYTEQKNIELGADRIRDFLSESKLERVRRNPEFQEHVPLPLGDINPDLAIELGDAVKRSGATIRVGIEHDFYLFGESKIELPGPISGYVADRTVVACPGTTWCSRGIADARAVAQSLLEAISANTPLNIAISGCPNNCSQTAITDIGLIGRVKRIDGEKVEHFRLLAGGGLGRSERLAHELFPAVPIDRVAEVVAFLLREFDDSRHDAGISFEQFIEQNRDRLIEKLQQQLAT